MKLFGIIYLITNLLNGKKYVGQTVKTAEKRFNEHARENTVIGRAIRKHRSENFTVEVIELCPVELLNEREIFWIRELGSKAPNGYNLTDGGKGIVGLKRTPEHCAKISEARKGKPFTAEHCANISALRRGKSSFKNLLKELDQRRLTYDELAKLLGMARQNISRKMLGQRNFTARDKAKLSEIFGKPVEYLMFKEVD